MGGLNLRRVGLLMKEDVETIPVGRVERQFAEAGIEMVILNDAARGDLDLVLVLGGDGTVLHALSRYPTVPTVAVNYGTVGFLTAGDSEDLEQAVSRLIAGDYFIEDRLLLRSRFQGESYLVVNELVVKGTTKMISVDVIVDDIFIHTVRGDGVIVGTPTGSTSYLMSTGSSIVMPTVDCFILAGINEYRFSSRSLILDARSRVRLRISESTRETDIFVAHDGRDKHSIRSGDEVEIYRCRDRMRMVFFERGYFFRNLKNRLDW